MWTVSSRISVIPFALVGASLAGCFAPGPDSDETDSQAPSSTTSSTDAATSSTASSTVGQSGTTSESSPPACGNGEVEGDEECDDPGSPSCLDCRLTDDSSSGGTSSESSGASTSGADPSDSSENSSTAIDPESASSGDPDPALPTIERFTSSVTNVPAGGASVRLSWQVSDASEVRIDPGIGVVSGETLDVEVAQTTTFVLTATNNAGDATASRTVRSVARGIYDTSWGIQFGTTELDWARAVTVDHNNDIIVAGSTQGTLDGTNPGTQQLFVAKYDSAGSLVWVRQRGEGKAYSVVSDANGGIHLLNAADTNGAPQVLVHYTGDGDFVDEWELERANGLDLVMSPDGGYYVAGHDSTYYITHYGQDATSSLVAEVSSLQSNASIAISVGGSGDIYGCVGSIGFRLTGAGDEVWSDTIDSTLEMCTAVAVSGEYVYSTGRTSGDLYRVLQGSYDVFVLARSIETGEVVEGWQFGTSDSDFGADLVPDSDDGVYIVGAQSMSVTTGFFRSGAPFVAQYSVASGQAWLTSVDLTLGTIQNNHGGMGVAVGSNGYVYVVGPVEGEFVHESAGSADAFIARMR